jgi:hypothetical protein
MYSLIGNLNRLNLPIDLQIELFNKTVKPILLYGSEICGYGNIDVIERVQLKFLKHILKLKRSTASYFIYGETGCMPLSVDIGERIVSFWARLLQNENGLIPNKLSYFVYHHMLRNTIDINDNDFERYYPWIYNLKSILIKCGINNVGLIIIFPVPNG